MRRRVALNAAIQNRGPSGEGTAVGQIASAFDGWDGWDLFLDRPCARPRTRPGRLAASLAWDFHTFARNARAAGRDTLIFPSNVGRRMPGQRSILVMHDVMVLEHADCFDRGYHLTARMTFPLAARSNDVIVTVSEHSARAIRKRFDPAWMEIIPWHAPATSPVVTPRDERIRQFLAVAPTMGHKRAHLAVEAVATVNDLTGDPMRLLIVGREGVGEALLRETIDRLDPHGRFVERRRVLARAELETAYASSYGLIVPSFDEGFGLPLLEAASHGTPAVHTRLGALQEVLPVPGIPVDHGVFDLVQQLLGLLDAPHWHCRQAAGFAAVRRSSKELFVDRWRSLVSKVAHAD